MMPSYPFPNDTHLNALRIQFSILKKIGAQKRAEMAVELSEGLRETVKAGIRQRHPEYNETMINLAALRLSMGKSYEHRAFPHLRIQDL